MTWNLAQTMSLIKAAQHKYTHRKLVGRDPKTNRPRYRYYYARHHGGGITSAKFEAGSAFRLTFKGRTGHFHVESVDGDRVTVRHDGRKNSKPIEMSRDELRALLERQHSKLETKSREKAQKRRKSAAKKRKSTKRQAPAKRSQWSVADQVEEHRGQLLDQAKSLKERIEGLDKKKDKKEIERLRDEAGALSGAALLAQRAQRDGVENAGPMIQKQIEQTQRMIDRSDNAEHTARLTRDREQKRKLLEIIEGKTQIEPERPKREKAQDETAQQGADNFETMPEELPNEPFEMRIARENIGKVQARLKTEREKGKTEQQLSMLNQMLESARRDYAAELAEYRAEQENPSQREAERQAEREVRERERQEEETKRTQAREAAQRAEREAALKGLSAEDRAQISTVVSELDKTGGKILKVEKQGNGYLVTVDPFSALSERPKTFGFGRSRGSDIRSTTSQRTSRGHAADAETTAHVKDFGKRLKNIIKEDERFEDFHMVKRPKKKRVADGRSWYPVDNDEENHFVFEFEPAQPSKTPQQSQTAQAFSGLVDAIKSGEGTQAAQRAFKVELDKVLDKTEAGTLTDAERAELLPIAEQLVDVTSGRARGLMTAVRDQIKEASEPRTETTQQGADNFETMPEPEAQPTTVREPSLNRLVEFYDNETGQGTPRIRRALRKLSDQEFDALVDEYEDYEERRHTVSKKYSRELFQASREQQQLDREISNATGAQRRGLRQRKAEITKREAALREQRRQEMDAIDSEFKDAPSLLTGPLLYEERFRRQERAEKRRLKAQSKPKAKPKAKPKPEGKRNEEIDGMTIAQRIIARSRGVK